MSKVSTRVVGVVVVGWLGGGCAPGSLPCDKEDWKAICNGSGGGTGQNGGAGGGGAGGGAGQGGAGGMSGTLNAGTAIANCDAYKTVGAMDQFFQNRCATSSACHPTNNAFGDYKSANVFERVGSAKTLGSCMGSSFVDPGGDLSKSVMWVKTQATPTCADGKSAGARMPNPPAMPLDDAETKCLEGFIKAVAGK